MHIDHVKTLLVASIAGALTLGSGGLAHADPSTTRSPESIASQTLRAAQSAGVDSSLRNGFFRSDAKTVATKTQSGRTQVSISTPVNTVVQSSEYGDFSVSLPDSGKDSSVAGDGSTVVISDAASTSNFAMAISSLNDASTRAQAVLFNSSAPNQYSYSFDSADTVELDADGGASIYLGQGEDRTSIGSVKPAWARDAAGRAVPTHFEVSGNRLTQVVDHRDGHFAYPIVADPSWSDIAAAIKKGGAKVARAAKWLGSKAGWVVGKAWSGVTAVAPKGYKAGKFLAKKAGPLGVVLCASGAGWSWYRSDANGWVRVGDAVSGCLF